MAPRIIWIVCLTIAIVLNHPGSSVILNRCSKECPLKNQFNCPKTSKCLPNWLWCNYDNDCGDKQDELHCKERCNILFGTIRYRTIKHSKAPCSGGLNGFRLVWAEHYIRWSTKCCIPFALHSFRKRFLTTHWTSYRRVYHLSRQVVDCGKFSFLKDFLIDYRLRKIRFRYNCLDMKRTHRKRTRCILKHTAWGKDGNGKIASQLTNQIFDCPPRYFINYFRMTSKPKASRIIGEGKWRHAYRCCRIVP